MSTALRAVSAPRTAVSTEAAAAPSFVWTRTASLPSRRRVAADSVSSAANRSGEVRRWAPRYSWVRESVTVRRPSTSSVARRPRSSRRSTAAPRAPCTRARASSTTMTAVALSATEPKVCRPDRWPSKPVCQSWRKGRAAAAGRSATSSW
ncbi:hypothetical protein ACFQVA_26735 [Actinomadura keratinilytica]